MAICEVLLSCSALPVFGQNGIFRAMLYVTVTDTMLPGLLSGVKVADADKFPALMPG